MTQKVSLAHDFTIFSAIIFCIVASLSAGVGLLIYQSYYDKQELQISHKANILERELAESFSFVMHYAKFIGKKMSNHNSQEETYAKEVFKSYKIPDSEKEVWSHFYWVPASEDRFLDRFGTVINTLLTKTTSYPNILQFSQPFLSDENNNWSLPVGVGITNSQGKYLGTIVAYADLESLSHKLDMIFANNELAFFILSDEMSFIASSSNVNFSYNRIIPPGQLLRNVETSLAGEIEPRGILHNKINYQNYRFTYFRQSYQYPFYLILGEDLRITNVQYWKIILPRIAELLLMGILFIIVLYYFRKRIVKPIIILSEAAKKIALGEKYVEIIYGKYQEVDLLADQLKEIQQTKQDLIKEKNKVEIMNQDLENKVKNRTIELENALQIKTEFLNNISHEVRTPVQGITNISQGLVEKWQNHDDKTKLSLATAVASNSRRLFSLVSNLLDLSTFNSGKMIINTQPSDFIAVIEDIADECNTLYLIQKDIKIIFKKHPKTLILSIDSEKIAQVLRNLISNAIKFMNSGEIIISIEHDKAKNSYITTIRDQGISIPENELESIFFPFVRSSITKNQMNGIGLGLSICQKIIEKHGGEIWAENNKNIGASFKFSLPIRNACENKTINKAKIKSGNILMIDDEPSCQMSMDILLSNTGYHLISTYGGVSGLQYLCENYKNIDLVLLDLMMPDMYGVNVLQEIKSNKLLADIPVVIQSGTNDYREIEKTLSLGAQAYIRKPYQRQQILDVISSI
jgi:two-component system, sensor histidine kinase ChiS